MTSIYFQKLHAGTSQIKCTYCNYSVTVTTVVRGVGQRESIPELFTVVTPAIRTVILILFN